MKKKQLDIPSPSQEWEATEHFIGSTPVGGVFNLVAAAVGGSAQIAPGTLLAAGIVQLSTGTTATGNYMLRGTRSALLPGGKFNYRMRFRYRLPTAGINSVDPAIFIIGFGNSNAAGEGALGIGAFLYIDSIDNIMYFVTKSTLGRSVIAHVSQPAAKWLECEISMQSNSIVKFQIQNDEDSLNYTTFLQELNYPNSGCNICASISKTTGTTARLLELDFISFGFNTYPPIG